MPKSVRRIDPNNKDVGAMLEAIDDELKEDGDRLGLHWGFYCRPYESNAGDPIRERHRKPWPETIVVLVRGGDNEGWMIELWDWNGLGPDRGPKSRVGMAKIISTREDAFEFARLTSVAAGVL